MTGSYNETILELSLIHIYLTEVGTQAGDFKTSDLGTALEPYLYQIADEMKKYCDGLKTVVFLPLHPHFTFIVGAFVLFC